MFETCRGTLGDFWNGLGDARGGPRRVGGLSVKFGTGRGTIGEVRTGRETLREVRD